MSVEAEIPAHPSAIRRRWFAFSLRTLLVLVTVLALWLGYMVHTARVQREAVMELGQLHVKVSYDFECVLEPNGEIIPIIHPLADPRGPSWLSDLIGVDFFNTVVVVVAIGSYDRASEEHEVRVLLPAICRLTGIRRLGIVAAGLRDEDVVQLSVLKELDSLYLSHNPVTDDGLRHISAFPKLKYLNLQKTKITDAGLKSLLLLRRLVHVDLRGTQITDAGLETLAQLPSLSKLDIQQTRVTSEGIHRLQSALPNLKITADYDRVRPSIELDQ